MRVIEMGEQLYCVLMHGVSLSEIKGRFILNAKVKRESFAGIYLDKIFNNVFGNSIDLKNDYIDFYQKEYDSFEDFLFHKELLSNKEIERFQLKSYETLMKLNIETNSYNAKSLFSHGQSITEDLNRMFEGTDKK